MSESTADFKVNPSISEQLMMLRSLTKLTGALHEGQLEQLKRWPWAVQPNLDKFTIEIDQETNLIRYLLIIDKKRKVNKKTAYLAVWAKWLLGDEWRVVINVNGKEYTPSNNGPGRTRKTAGAGRRARVSKRK